MSAPKILLISRTSCREFQKELQEFLQLVRPAYALAHNTEDADAAKAVSDTVACFHQPVAIVADFPADLLINEDGSIEPLHLPGTEIVPRPNIILCE